MLRAERVCPQGEWTVVARAAAMLALVAGTSMSAAQVGLNDLLGDSDAPEAETAAQDADALDALADNVTVDEHFLVDLHVNDEDLGNVLQLLSIQSQRNIVASKDVAASVTANLYGVTFYEALDAILNVNGYGYIERGNFIYVYTLEELTAIEQATRQREARVITLNYLTATDAAAFVAPMLTEGGTITTNGRTTTFNIPDDAPVGADEYANDGTLVVFDYPDRIDEIAAMIGQLDSRPQQVLVEATILQSELNEANAFGVDFSIIADLDFADFISPLGAAGGLASAPNFEDGSVSDGTGFAASSTPGGTSTGPATFRTGIIAEDFAIFMRLLDEVSDTTILSNPKILSLNRQPSRVLVGRKVGYLSTTNTETASTQTVEFLDTGTQLYFRPFVTNDGFIRMELKPQVSEAVIREVSDASGASVTIPDEITNELVTNVMVRDGQTVVLGGLFREATVASRSQVPIVGDIPIIGAAFRGYDDETSRSEIIFMITPSIVSDMTLADQGREAEGYVSDVVAGARGGLLPFSRERQSQQLLVEAERLAATGDVDKALHKVRRSLELKPNQPNALRLQERLINREAIWPTNSILRDLYDNETEIREQKLRNAEPARFMAPWSGNAMTAADPIVPPAQPQFAKNTAPKASSTTASNAQPQGEFSTMSTDQNAWIVGGEYHINSTENVPSFSDEFDSQASAVDPLFESNTGVESWPAPANNAFTQDNDWVQYQTYDPSMNETGISEYDFVETNDPFIQQGVPTFESQDTPAFPSDVVTGVDTDQVSAAPAQDFNHDFVEGNVSTQAWPEFVEQPVANSNTFESSTGVNNAFVETNVVSDAEWQSYQQQNTPSAYTTSGGSFGSTPANNVAPTTNTVNAQGVNPSFIQSNAISDADWQAYNGGNSTTTNSGSFNASNGAVANGVNPAFIENNVVTDAQWNQYQQNAQISSVEQAAMAGAEGMAPPPANASLYNNTGVASRQFDMGNTTSANPETEAQTRSMIRFFEGWDDFARDTETEDEADSSTEVTNVPTETDPN